MAVLQAEVAALQDANAELRHRLRESDARLASASAEASRRTEEANAAHGEYPPIPWRGCGSSLTSPHLAPVCVVPVWTQRRLRVYSASQHHRPTPRRKLLSKPTLRMQNARYAGELLVWLATHTHTHTKTHTHTHGVWC